MFSQLREQVFMIVSAYLASRFCDLLSTFDPSPASEQYLDSASLSPTGPMTIQTPLAATQTQRSKQRGTSVRNRGGRMRLRFDQAGNRHLRCTRRLDRLIGSDHISSLGFGHAFQDGTDVFERKEGGDLPTCRSRIIRLRGIEPRWM